MKPSEFGDVSALICDVSGLIMCFFVPLWGWISFHTKAVRLCYNSLGELWLLSLGVCREASEEKKRAWELLHPGSGNVLCDREIILPLASFS